MSMSFPPPPAANVATETIVERPLAHPRHRSGRRHAAIEGLTADDRSERMRVGDHQHAAGLQHPRQFGHRFAGVGEVTESQRYDRQVELVVGERQVFDVTDFELRLRQLLASDREHRFRLVEPDRRASQLVQECSLAAGSAGVRVGVDVPVAQQAEADDAGETVVCGDGHHRLNPPNAGEPIRHGFDGRVGRPSPSRGQATFSS